MKKRLCSLALVLIMCLGLVPGMAEAAELPRQVGADVQGAIDFPDQAVDGFIKLSDEQPYVLRESKTVNDPILIENNDVDKSVELILPEGVTLTAAGGIEGGMSLTISSRSGSTGTLTGGEDNTLRISGVTLIVNGGQVIGISSKGHGIEITGSGVLEVHGGKVIGETTCVGDECGIYSNLGIQMTSGSMQVSAVKGSGAYGGTFGVIIEGGRVDAAESGGVAGDAVTISGGIVIGDVDVSGRGEGFGPEDIFGTGGNAWIISQNPITIRYDQENGDFYVGPPDLSQHSGFFTIGNVTEVWGDQVLPEQLPKELGPEPVIKVCGTLTIPEGRRFVNEGRVVVCHGGKLINNGTIDNTHGLLQEERNQVTFRLDANAYWEKEPVTGDKIVYALKSAEQKIFTGEQPTFSGDSRLELGQIPKVKFDQPYAGGRWSINGTMPTDITQLTIEDNMVFTIVSETEFAEINWSEQGPVVTTMFGLQFEGTLFAAGYADGKQVIVTKKAMGPYESVLLSEPEFQKADTVKVFWLDENGVPLYGAVSKRHWA